MPILPASHAVERFVSSYSELEATLQNLENPKKRNPAKELRECRRFVDRFVQNALDIKDLEEAPGLVKIALLEEKTTSQCLGHVESLTKKNREFAVECMAFAAAGAILGSLIAIHRVISKYPNGNSKLDWDDAENAMENRLNDLQQPPPSFLHPPAIILNGFLLRNVKFAEKATHEDFRIPPLIGFFEQEVNAYGTHLKKVIKLRPLEIAADLADEIKRGAALGSLIGLRAWLVNPWTLRFYQINSKN